MKPLTDEELEAVEGGKSPFEYQPPIDVVCPFCGGKYVGYRCPREGCQ